MGRTTGARLPKEHGRRDVARRRTSPVVQPSSSSNALLSLQRSVGNQAVLGLVSVQRKVQRKENDLTLDDDDFSPEQALDLDSRFQSDR